MKVIYPVLFYEEKEGGYSVFVPDLQKELDTSASTCGTNHKGDIPKGTLNNILKQAGLK